MELAIVPRYAALLALGMILLSVRVIRLRRLSKVAIGAQDAPLLERAMRAHGNFCEYVPFAVILLAFVEVAGNPAWLLHGLCGLLLLGRAVHAFGLSQPQENFRFRTFGMATTFAVVGVSSILLITGRSLFAALIG